MDISAQSEPYESADPDAERSLKSHPADEASQTARRRVEEHLEQRRLAQELVSLEIAGMEPPPARARARAAPRKSREHRSKFRNRVEASSSRHVNLCSFEPDAACGLDQLEL